MNTDNFKDVSDGFSLDRRKLDCSKLSYNQCSSVSN